MSDNPKSLDEIDSFWDFESFIPSRRATANKKRTANVDTVEIDMRRRSDPHKAVGLDLSDWKRKIGEDSKTRSTYNEKNDCGRGISGDQISGEPLVYVPENPLIKGVVICKVRYPISFYRDFKRDAQRLWSKTSSKCDRVPFFAYVPQHSQLDYAQLKWYLYWRSRALEGELLPTDYSYILLFIYEIINCPELIEPSRGLELLTSLWVGFGAEYPKLELVLGNWLCDYCLIHRLKCPREKLGHAIIEGAVKRVRLPEFYMGMQEPRDCAAELIARLTTHDWRKSKYWQSDNAELFDRHIVSAFSRVYCEELIKDISPTYCEKEDSWLSYEDALCEPETKKLIKVKYAFYDRPKGRDNVINEIVRYCDNQVRAGLGISQRLRIEQFPDSIKHCIDEYFSENFPPLAQQKRKLGASKRRAEQLEAEHRYDSLYEPTGSGFSLENALAIERSSWDTTEVLTNALRDVQEDAEPLVKDSDEPISSAAPVPSVPNDSTDLTPSDFALFADENGYEELISSLEPECCELLRLLADGDHKAAVRIASKTNALADALVDRINEEAFRLTGDSIIEPCGEGYKIISDYMEELLPCLK